VVPAEVPAEDRSDAGALSKAEQRRRGMSTNALADREREVEQARTTLAEVTERRDVLLADAEQLRRRLNDVEQQLRPTEAEVRSARRRLETAQRALSQASERLTRGHRT
jgi:chromosome segregation ATPase